MRSIRDPECQVQDEHTDHERGRRRYLKAFERVRSSTVACLLVDDAGTILDANNAAAMMSLQSAETLMSRAVSALVMEDDRLLFRTALRLALRSGKASVCVVTTAIDRTVKVVMRAIATHGYRVSHCVVAFVDADSPDVPLVHRATELQSIGDAIHKQREAEAGGMRLGRAEDSEPITLVDVNRPISIVGSSRTLIEPEGDAREAQRVD